MSVMRQVFLIGCEPPSPVPRKIGAEQFWDAPAQAQDKIVLLFGTNWRVVAPWGDTALVDLPPRLRSFTGPRGGKVSFGRDWRMPAGHYWPGGKLPLGLTLGNDPPRETAPVANWPRNNEGYDKWLKQWKAEQHMPGDSMQITPILVENPMVGLPKQGGRKFWTTREIKLLDVTYPAGGLTSCLELLPGRSAQAIYEKARLRKLFSPVERAALMKRNGFPRRRWTGSEQIDETIRRRWPDAIRRSDVQRIADAVSRPRSWVSKRAATLGLVMPRFKESDWTAPELELVERHAHRVLATIQRKLAAAGYTRTETAIKIKLRRLGADRTDPNHFTAHGLADVMGYDSKAVTRWIEQGMLVAKRRGTARTPQQGGDQHWIHRRDVRRFLIKHIGAVDVRKADKWWLVDILTNGKE